MVNIISDIAGEYDTLLALLKKMPDEEVISVGDMVDRGPKSKEVVDWFMKNGKAIMGNHEHMMVDHLRDNFYYNQGIWQWNGGNSTLQSYAHHVPEEVIAWMEKLPLYMEFEGCLIAHSFVEAGLTLEQACSLGASASSSESRQCILWNRYEPARIEKYEMQIAGHNSQWGLRRFNDQFGEFAVCLDDCRQKKLTGIHLPSYTVYQQDYI